MTLIEEGFVIEQGLRAYPAAAAGLLMYAINASAMYIMAIAMDQLSTPHSTRRLVEPAGSGYGYVRLKVAE